MAHELRCNLQAKPKPEIRFLTAYPNNIFKTICPCTIEDFIL